MSNEKRESIVDTFMRFSKYNNILVSWHVHSIYIVVLCIFNLFVNAAL